jgi:hypothetical protein
MNVSEVLRAPASSLVFHVALNGWKEYRQLSNRPSMRLAHDAQLNERIRAEVIRSQTEGTESEPLQSMQDGGDIFGSSADEYIEIIGIARAAVKRQRVRANDQEFNFLRV